MLTPTETVVRVLDGITAHEKLGEPIDRFILSTRTITDIAERDYCDGMYLSNMTSCMRSHGWVMARKGHSDDFCFVRLAHFESVRIFMPAAFGIEGKDLTPCQGAEEEDDAAPLSIRTDVDRALHAALEGMRQVELHMADGQALNNVEAKSLVEVADAAIRIRDTHVRNAVMKAGTPISEVAETFHITHAAVDKICCAPLAAHNRQVRNARKVSQ